MTDRGTHSTGWTKTDHNSSYPAVYLGAFGPGELKYTFHKAILNMQRFKVPKSLDSSPFGKSSEIPWHKFIGTLVPSNNENLNH